MSVVELPAEPAVIGSVEPRLMTEPLRPLTRETSYGFAVISFAEQILGEPLDDWQKWLVVHAGELLADGRPRFRQILVLVSRQNGKTWLLRTLALFWLFEERLPMVLGLAQTLDISREAWEATVNTAQANAVLEDAVSRVRYANGEQLLETTTGGRYRIAAASRKGGRGLTVDRLIMDEIREQRTWDAFSAATPTTAARLNAQTFMISNAGDDQSIVLNSLREAALAGTDQRLGIFEWSAPEGCDVDDPQAWAMANPSLGGRLAVDTLAGLAARAKAAGGAESAHFRTEHLCQHVPALDAAVDAGAWNESTIPSGDLVDCRGRVSVALDVAPDGQHATLVAAGEVRPGVCRIVVAKAWDGMGCSEQIRADLPGLLALIKPRTFGWFPGGPAAALAADFAKRGEFTAPVFPRTTLVAEIRGDVSASAMGFADRVKAGSVEHLADPLLDAHILGAERLRFGDTWRFSRRGGHCDAAYAAAGATHLAMSLPAGRSVTRPSSIS